MNLRTSWWTATVREAIKLKEAFWAWLASCPVSLKNWRKTLKALDIVLTDLHLFNILVSYS